MSDISETTMERWNDRTIKMLGVDGVNLLASSHVVVVGVGGVGGYAAEMLVRSGVGEITIIDADDVSVTNINRQLIADNLSVGQPKVELFEQRFKAINADIKVNAHKEYLSAENLTALIPDGVDFVVDAIDTVAPKVALIEYCLRNKVGIVSSMGAGGRIDPTAVRYADIWDTKEDGLARAVRQRMKKIGLRRSLAVVCSDERPMSHSLIALEETNKRSSYGTLATIPSLFGIYLANYVVRKITSI